jgi:hypothetical protein
MGRGLRRVFAQAKDEFFKAGARDYEAHYWLYGQMANVMTQAHSRLGKGFAWAAQKTQRVPVLSTPLQKTANLLTGLGKRHGLFKGLSAVGFGMTENLLLFHRVWEKAITFTPYLLNYLAFDLARFGPALPTIQRHFQQSWREGKAKTDLKEQADLLKRLQSKVGENATKPSAVGKGAGKLLKSAAQKGIQTIV